MYPHHVETVDLELAWAAGLFEGRGSVSQISLTPRLSLKLADDAETTVRRFARAVGFGTVYGPYGPYESQLWPTARFMWVADRESARCAAVLLAEHVSEPMRCRLLRLVADSR